MIDSDERKWPVAISENEYDQHSEQTMARKTDTNLKPKTVNSPSQETVGPEEVASRAGVSPSYMFILIQVPSSCCAFSRCSLKPYKNTSTEEVPYLFKKMIVCYSWKITLNCTVPVILS